MASSSGMPWKRKYPLSEKTQQEMLDDLYNNLDEDKPCGFLAGCFPADVPIGVPWILEGTLTCTKM